MGRWEFSHGIIGVNAPSWLTFEIHRPYFDGADSPYTVIQARGPLLAARRFEQRQPAALRFGMNMPASYRQLLVEESRLVAYRIRTPTELSRELASETWRRMSDAFSRHDQLDAVARAGLAHWLVAVCLPAAVLDVVPADLDTPECRNQIDAAIQAARAAALFQLEGLSARTVAAYKPLVDNPGLTITHVQAVAGWGYLLSRHAGDHAAAPMHLARAGELLKEIACELTDFEHAILHARLLLREVMYAERERDFAGARQLLRRADAAVAEAEPATADEQLLITEMRRRLIDRTVDIAVRLEDWQAERQAIDDGIALDPYCVKIRMQAAQSDERRGHHEQALAGYLAAARLGPFGTAFALLRAATCARSLGYQEFARVLTERAFRAAPRSERTRDALVQSCTAAGDLPLADVVRRASRRNPDRPYENNWHYQMYASYFNLGESRSPCLYARLPTLAYEFAKQGVTPDINWQRLMPPAFRTNLVRESGLTDFAVSHPHDLPRDLRTLAWDELCEWVEGFDSSDLLHQHLTAMVLYRLGFGKLVLELIPERPVSELKTAEELRHHHLRDIVQYITSVGAAKVILPQRSFEIAEHASCPLQLRFAISVFAVVISARETRSTADAIAWRNTAEQCLAELLANEKYTAYEKMMMESRFYRSVTYVPFLLRDRERLAAEMTRAEELARAMPASTPYEDFLKRENLRACVESRSKEAIGFGDQELAHRRIEEVLAIDPYEPKSHMEMAESLRQRGEDLAAGNSYLRTARLGPIGTAIGYALAGDCFERAGHAVLAEDCFVQALRIDPYAVSAARGWRRTATKGATADTADAMAHLAAEYVDDLERWGAARRAARSAMTAT